MIKKSLLFITCIFVNLAAMDPAPVTRVNESGQPVAESQIHPVTGLPMPDLSALRGTRRAPRPSEGRQIINRLYEIHRSPMYPQDEKYRLMSNLHQRAANIPRVRKDIYRTAIAYAPNRGRIMQISRDEEMPLATRIADLEALRSQVDSIEAELIRDQISKLNNRHERANMIRTVQGVLTRNRLQEIDMDAVTRGLEALGLEEVRNLQENLNQAEQDNDIDALAEAIRSFNLDSSTNRPGDRPNRRDRMNTRFPRTRHHRDNF